jgi:hypothetical protein
VEIAMGVAVDDPVGVFRMTDVSRTLAALKVDVALGFRSHAVNSTTMSTNTATVLVTAWRPPT